jgi:hypothetical protein
MAKSAPAQLISGPTIDGDVPLASILLFAGEPNRRA